jgi:hypothetical protein
MTDAVKQDVETAGFFADEEISTFDFDSRQSTLLHKLAEELAAIGGPQAPGAALWNPSLEPTRVIPLPPILEKIGVPNCLALTTDNFQFTRSDSFVSGKGEDGRNVSILEFDDKVGFAARFNSYRFSVNDNASTFVKTAYTALCQGVSEATPVEYTLTQESAMTINNVRALHCRDVIKDNRRVLVRIFGLSKFSSPIVISDDPLLLQG